MNRNEIKKALHRARMNLAYRKKHATPEIITETQAEVDRLTEAFRDSSPCRCTIRVRSPYFIGPRRKKGVRGEGPTIRCFRCEKEKPICDFYKRGTLCKKCVQDRSAEWAKKNPKRSRQLKNIWASKNRDKINAKSKRAYYRDIHASRNRSRKYRLENREKCNAIQGAYLKRRMARDPKFRALATCRRRMWILFKSAGLRKNTRSSELLGIDKEGFYRHLESLFLPGMTWENRGLGRGCWHIDHIIPCSAFDMTDPEQVKKCWHYTNLRPLWAEDNWAKGDKIPVDYVLAESNW